MPIHPHECPHCHSNLDGGDIYDKFIELGYGEQRALEAATHFGWTKDNPKRFSRVLGQYDITEDRVMSYSCPFCQLEI
jgi:hypothetical protein